MNGRLAEFAAYCDGSNADVLYETGLNETVGTYPPVRISKDMLYVILLSCGSRRMHSGALDEDLEHTSIYINQFTFCLWNNHAVHLTVYTVPSW
jgi:hypothetical protein